MEFNRNMPTVKASQLSAGRFFSRLQRGLERTIGRITCLVISTLVIAGCALPIPAAIPAVMPPEVGPARPSSLVDGFRSPVGVPEPTATPLPADAGVISIEDLAVGRRGTYTNVLFGYGVQYPTDWHTQFGNRPLLASFSNLDPGNNTRISMRETGCLIEINAQFNPEGLSLPDLIAFLPKTFAGAETVQLGGKDAAKVTEDSGLKPYTAESVLVEHDDRLLRISMQYAPAAVEVCRPVWEEMLATWTWFTPDFVVYRNISHKYSVSYPRGWFRFNEREEGVVISSTDPTAGQDLAALSQQGMVVYTTTYDNPDHLRLTEWFAANEEDFDLTNRIPADDLLGIRGIRNYPDRQMQEVSGYFQGPLGEIYVVSCFYPENLQRQFRPIANAIVYSFGF